jgi:nicotinate-nucleotide adenylyltransferase
MQQDSPATRRVAFFGGTFDPPHRGHIAIARAARDALRLDSVLFAPVGAQPLKPEGTTAPYKDRVAMTELAIDGERAFAISAIDAPNASGRPNYTLHTLQKLRGGLPQVELFCLIGADSFLSLRKWYGAPEIPFAADLIVASRPGQRFHHLAAVLPLGLTARPCNHIASADPGIELEAYELHNSTGQKARLFVLPGLDIAISATAIREQLRSGEQLRGGNSAASPAVVPASVAQYIREHGLYR